MTEERRRELLDSTSALLTEAERAEGWRWNWAGTEITNANQELAELAPGMTDLMVAPEEIDKYLEVEDVLPQLADEFKRWFRESSRNGAWSVAQRLHAVVDPDGELIRFTDRDTQLLWESWQAGFAFCLEAAEGMIAEEASAA